MEWFFEGMELLRNSEKLYVTMGFHPPRLKPVLVQNLFHIGGLWMKKVLKKMGRKIRSRRLPPFQELGYFKYGLASWAALLAAFLLFQVGPIPALGAAVLVFYLVESQMVFLFPLSIEGSGDPIRESLWQVRRAGGTWKVLTTVALLALYMLTGGFFKGSVKKSWCIGCLAVLVWHLKLNKRMKPHGIS